MMQSTAMTVHERAEAVERIAQIANAQISTDSDSTYRYLFVWEGQGATNRGKRVVGMRNNPHYPAVRVWEVCGVYDCVERKWIR